MTSENKAMKAPTLDNSIDQAPRPPDAKMMKAIVQAEYGSAPEDVLQLVEIDRPTTGGNEVLVRVRAASMDRGT